MEDKVLEKWILDNHLKPVYKDILGMPNIRFYDELYRISGKYRPVDGSVGVDVMLIVQSVLTDANYVE